MCVQMVDVQCVLQFTLFSAACCVLHRPTSRVIHRLESCLIFFHRRPEARQLDSKEVCQNVVLKGRHASLEYLKAHTPHLPRS